jgi:protein-tyrosine kinase
MSRIEEALKRAREAEPEPRTGAAGATVAAPVGSPSVPPSTVFQDPWKVSDPLTSVDEPENGSSRGQAAPYYSGPAPVDAPGQRDISPSGRNGAKSPAIAGREALGGPEAAESGRPSFEGTEPDAKQDAENDPRGRGMSPDNGETPADDGTGPIPGLALFHAFNPLVAEKIVATPDIRPAFVEQYRKLAGVLHHAQLQKNVKVVMVTSAIAGEGKTLTATNLALTFSESYRRSVLLIDADLRRPTLHETFQVPNVSGLGDGLRADKEQKLSLVQVSPRLTLLTAGRPDPDPMSGLASDRMRRVIEEATSRFDWVIIDTPPVGLLPDAKLMAAMADVTLLVVRATRTPYSLVRRAVDSIGRERIFGVVLNRAEDGMSAGGYSYYGYYDRYSKER